MTNIDFGSNRIVLPKPDRIRASVDQRFCISRRLLMGSPLICARKRADPVQPRARDGKFSQKKFLLSG